MAANDQRSQSAPNPEKGEPHGAATLLRIPKVQLSGPLPRSCAFPGPCSCRSQKHLTSQSRCDGSTLGQFRLLLHGYFFLDSGRRQIEGLDAAVETGEPSDASALRWAWNSELRDSVVLPLLPTLLRDALDATMVTSSELAKLVLALARHDWFQRNREAMCRESALVRVLEAPGGVVWRVVSSGVALRPLPASVADAPQRIGELFGAIGAWAEASGARLVVDDSTALSARPIRWTEADLGCSFSGLSPRAFQSRDLAPLLVDFLGMAVLGDAERSAIGPHMVTALRKAMPETQRLPPPNSSNRLLPMSRTARCFRSLHPSRTGKSCARWLSVPANVLPVRSEWLDDGRRSPQVSHEDLKALLTALQPLIEGDHADQAATAALALLARAERGISELAGDREFASVKVLRARDVRISSPVALSLKTLVARSREGLLFTNSLKPTRCCRCWRTPFPKLLLLSWREIRRSSSGTRPIPSFACTALGASRSLNS